MKKTNLHKLFDTDEKLETEGKWFEVSPGVSFKLKREGGRNNLRNQIELSKAYAPFRKEIDEGTLDPEKNQEIINSVFIDTCVVDWKGLEDEDGPIEFSKKECLELFKALPEVKDILMSLAGSRHNFLKDEVGK